MDILGYGKIHGIPREGERKKETGKKRGTRELPGLVTLV